MLQIEHPFALTGLLLLCLLIAIYIYRRDQRFSTAPTYTKYCLILLRFTSFSLLCLLLLKAKWIHEEKKIEKPIIVLLQDASSSILNYSDSNYYKNNFPEIIEKNNTQLSENFEVYNFHFSKELKEGLTNNYKGVNTDIANAFKSIDDKFHNRNLAAIILASDGNYNTGNNPYYITKELNTPVYCLSLGDSTLEKDVSIESVRHNEIAHFENEFPIKFDVLSNFNSKQNYKLKIIHKGTDIFFESVDLKSQSPLSKEIYIKATDEGVQYYDIEISSFDGEKNTDNNRHRIAIEVIKNIQNILILSAAPHPDISAIKQSIEKGKNYKVTNELFHKFNKEIEPYNLIILHQIPNNSNQNKSLLNKINQSEIALLYIGGNATDWRKFNANQDIIEVIYKNSIHEVFAVINDRFRPFELSDSCIYFIENTPPLLAPYGKVISKNVEHTLFKQEIEGIQTQQNLLCFSENEKRQTGVILGEGLWKWKLFDYQKNKNHNQFTELIQSIIQYLTLNKDKRKLRLQYQKLISEGDVFNIQAQLYNDNYQMIKDAELNLFLIHSSGSEYNYTLNADNDRYNKILNKLAKGNYQFVLTASYKDVQLEQKGAFSVLENKLEQNNFRSDWRLLNSITDISNGQMIQKIDFKNYANIISKNITSNSKIYFSQRLNDLIKKKSVFLLLLLCLLIEWTWRKVLGTH